MFSLCYNLKTVNLPKLYCCNPNSTTAIANNNYYYFYLMQRCGVEEVSLPSLTYVNPYYNSRIFEDCRLLKKVGLPNLQYLRGTSNTYENRLLCGCPKITSLELPELVSCGRHLAGQN